MKKIVLFCMSVCVFLAIIGVCGVLTPKGGDTGTAEPSGGNAEIAGPSAEEKLAHIKSSGDYPEVLIETAEKCPQTIDFVYAYPEKHGKRFDIDLTADARLDTVPLFIQWDERWGYWNMAAKSTGSPPGAFSGSTAARRSTTIPIPLSDTGTFCGSIFMA